MTRIRLAGPADLEPLLALRHQLWPDSATDQDTEELVAILAGKPPGVLPLVELVAEEADGTLVGFVEAGLRSYADGCDLARPPGYLEGWFVAESHRRRGIGAELVRAAEEWARAQGCVEMASDVVLENETSQHAHETLGYEEVGRSVLYRKRL